jgi:septum formation protein
MPDRRPLVLASTSRYRRALLDRLGLAYEARAPLYEEEHDLALPPDELVQELARRKAVSLGPVCPDALVLGADQVAELDGAVLLKPGTPERAVEQLGRLAGRTHRLLTGVALHDPRSGRTEVALDVHRMTLRPLTEAQRRAYVARDQPVDCAGAYKVEEAGIALFEAMEGRDFTAIVGLPLTVVVTLLGRFGYDVW